MQRILVTGGAGFIGSWLVKNLLESGHEILVYDSLERGKPEFLPDSANLRFVKGDILDEKMLSAVFEGFQPQIVIHLAAMHFIPDCVAKPRLALRINAEGAQAILDECKRSCVKKVIIASSAAVYPIRELPHKESEPINASEVYDNVYSVTKVVNERLLDEFSKRYADKVCIGLRIFNAFGPHETNPHLIPDIISELKNGDIIRLGNTESERDYVYVEDLADAIAKLAINYSQLGFDVFNIGAGQGHSAVDIVKAIAQLTGRPLRIEHVETKKRKIDRKFLIADISKIREATGWQPKTSFEEGLSRLLKYEGLVK